MAAAHPPPAIDLTSLAAQIRSHAGLTGKRPIEAVGAVVDTSDPIHGPGDDGAIVEIGDERIVACGEAMFPPFVRADPHGAGIAAVLANVNDVAAMGGVPRGIVNTIVAPATIAAEAMRGMREAAEMYDVPIIGGHLTERDGEPALSAFAVGQAQQVLSMANVEAGQDLILVCCLDGHMRDDFPFFTTIERQGPRLAEDIRLLAEIADAGWAVAAKDVSMAGPIGSLAMLLEFGRVGAVVDLEALPTPSDTDLGQWLISFPTFAFWLASPPEHTDRCLSFFGSRGLTAAVAAQVTTDPVLALRHGSATETVIDLGIDPVTGLWPLVP